MKVIYGALVHTEISVYDAEIEKLTGQQTDEWQPMYLDTSLIVTMREYVSKNKVLNGLPIITCKDGNSYILRELVEDILEAWVKNISKI